jgi:spore germination protein
VIALLAACQTVSRPLPAPLAPSPRPAVAGSADPGVWKSVPTMPTPTAPGLTLRAGDREWMVAPDDADHAFLDQLAGAIDRAPLPAKDDFVGGDPRPARDGLRLDRDGAAKAIARALAEGKRAVELPVVVVRAGPSPARPPKGRHTVMYHVPGDPKSWRSLDANWDAIDYVAAQWVSVNACGGLTTRDDQTLKAVARARGVGVLPSLLTYDGNVNHTLLANPTVARNLIDSIVEYVVAEEYAGFDIDLESIDREDRALYSAFIADLAAQLHARGKILAMAVPPKEAETTTGPAAAYDYAELGRHADVITLMTYEYAGTWGNAGPVAPHGPVRRAVAYAASLIPPEKLTLGLAFYGYDWNQTVRQVRSIGYQRALDLSQRYETPIGLDAASRSATFGYQAPSDAAYPRLPDAPPVHHTVTTRRAAPCAAKLPGKLPPPPGSATKKKSSSVPAPGGPHEHRVWIEDARSNAARLEIADRYGTGVAAWRLGLEDPAVWPVLRQWRSSPPGSFGSTER